MTFRSRWPGRQMTSTRVPENPLHPADTGQRGSLAAPPGDAYAGVRLARHASRNAKAAVSYLPNALKCAHYAKNTFQTLHRLSSLGLQDAPLSPMVAFGQ